MAVEEWGVFFVLAGFILGALVVPIAIEVYDRLEFRRFKKRLEKAGYKVQEVPPPTDDDQTEHPQFEYHPDALAPDASPEGEQ